LCSVHDTVAFEKRGIRSTTISSTAFKRAAEFQFRRKGMVGHPHGGLPHPVSNLQPTEMRELTLHFVDEVASHLMD